MSYRRETLEERAAELKSYRIRGDLIDEAGAPLAPGNLTSLTLKLFDENTKTIINGVNGLSILNVDRGNVDGAGHFTLLLKPDDSPILNDALAEEAHIAFVEWGFAANTKKGGIEIGFYVWNFVKLP
jgi:hypothetical protein